MAMKLEKFSVSKKESLTALLVLAQNSIHHHINRKIISLGECIQNNNIW